MVYSTDASKWRAYQFSDPFAAGSFYVCNKITSHFCRPDCDAHPVTELRSEIKFVNTAQDAVGLGFSPCKSCDPMQVPAIDVNLLLVTVREINSVIGFVPPLLDDDEDKVTETIKENLLGHGSVQRRMSVPMNAFSNKTTKPTTYAVSKNDSEHYRLIDLACRHLALAAAVSIFGQTSGSSSPKMDDSSLKKKGGRKRRGGVLGFKELATKSKLSAWHFHRVFKSIIGLTPKTYGDMCWEFLEKEKDAMDSDETTQRHASSLPLANSAKLESRSGTATPVIKEEPRQFDLQEPYLTPPHMTQISSPGSVQKRPRVCEEMPSSKRMMMASPNLSPFSNLELDDTHDQLSLQQRAISVPNLGAFAPAPNTLFQHSRNSDFLANRVDMPSTDSVFASHHPFNDPVPFSEQYSASFSNNISPATIDDYSPLEGAAIMPHDMMNFDMSLMMNAEGDQGFSFATDRVNEEDFFANMDLFPDLFKLKNEFATDYNLNDPLLPGFAPELMSHIDF